MDAPSNKNRRKTPASITLIILIIAVTAYLLLRDNEKKFEKEVEGIKTQSNITPIAPEPVEMSPNHKP